MTIPAIAIESVTKRFGTLVALDRVDLTVEGGTVVGLLGPNGAGKTTLVRILTALLRPDSGRASVAGYDVVRDAQALRSVIGLAGQYAAVDDLLTGRENLELVGRLHHLPRAERRRRAREALERFGLTEAGERTVKTYSGGMRRRLDLGLSLIGRPSVLLLDEPTTGLDPRTRGDVWEFVGALVAEGTTVLLTTQYLEEAERLADRIVVVDRGRVVADGTADELKAGTGGAVLQAQVSDRADLPRISALLAEIGDGPPQVDPQRRRITVPTTRGARALVEAGRRLDEDGVALDDLGIRRPSLDDVFLALTGHGAAS